jgi:isopenicillin N synthase-like dioxygenase
MEEQVPIVDIAVYYSDSPQEAQYAVQALHEAASTWGFVVITGTRVSHQIQSNVSSASQAFFNLPLETKLNFDVRNGGIAWRGYMPLGGEHTHGYVDWKEGLYFGIEQADDHPLVDMPLHGKNQFPDQILPDMRPQVLQYLDEVTNLGKTLTDMFSMGLGLGKDELRHCLLDPEPVVLFRCFKYAPVQAEEARGPTKIEDQGFGIGEHTGAMALLLQISFQNLPSTRYRLRLPHYPQGGLTWFTGQ